MTTRREVLGYSIFGSLLGLLGIKSGALPSPVDKSWTPPATDPGQAYSAGRFSAPWIVNRQVTDEKNQLQLTWWEWSYAGRNEEPASPPDHVMHDVAMWDLQWHKYHTPPGKPCYYDLLDDDGLWYGDQAVQRLIDAKELAPEFHAVWSRFIEMYDPKGDRKNPPASILAYREYEASRRKEA